MMLCWVERVTRQALFVFTPMGARTFQLQSVDAGDAFSPFCPCPLTVRYRGRAVEQGSADWPWKITDRRGQNKIKPNKRIERQTVKRKGGQKKKTRRENNKSADRSLYIHVQSDGREIHLWHKSRRRVMCDDTMRFLADFCSIQMTFSGQKEIRKRGRISSCPTTSSVLPRL